MRETILEVKDFSVTFENSRGRAVNHISFTMKEGEILGVVGESGSGKSMTALGVMGLLPNEGKTEGSIWFQGKELLSLSQKERSAIQGKEMGMVFQEPMTSLNPVMKIGFQVGESLALHTKLSREERKRKTLEALREAGLEDPEGIYGKYPHELSGGMRQRAMIAMAMINSPALLIADEPTTALDVLVQAQILKLIQRLHREKKVSVLFISHNLNIIREVCENVIVMRNGEILERGSVEKVFTAPEHEYTKKLVAAMAERKGGFTGEKKVLSIRHLRAFYRSRSLNIYKKEKIQEVLSDVSLDVHEGEIFGIVGESGCGKSTLARVITGLHKDYEGKVEMEEGLRPQMVFQDPFGSLNPARRIGWILEEPFRLKGIRDKEERRSLVKGMLSDVGLDESFMERYPKELSGGQRQRISIALALSMDSRLLIADEPVSALDVTTQTQIIELLLKINQEKKIALLFITHDLSLMGRICHRAAVLYKGRILEMGNGREIYENPKEEYTRRLLKAALAGTENTDRGGNKWDFLSCQNIRVKF